MAEEKTTIERLIGEITAMPLWDADIRAQGYEPVILCNNMICHILRGNSHYERAEEYDSAGTFCGLKIIIMQNVNCPVIAFIKVFHP